MFIRASQAAEISAFAGTGASDEKSRVISFLLLR
jgi:hypothetical protein